MNIACRFHFPFSTRETATVFKIANPKWKSYDPARNDPLLNTYKPTGFISCTNQHAVLGYIAKYCFGAKINFFKLIDVLRDVLSHLNLNLSIH